MIYIGISIGFNPTGIPAMKLELKNNHIFILDINNSKIITPINQNIENSFKIK